MSDTLHPILVTGTHRSGTTWVGKMLAAGPSTAYISEPCEGDTLVSICL